MPGEQQQRALLEEAIAGGTVQAIRAKAREVKVPQRKPSKAAKPKCATKKIRFDNGWVIIHYESETATREDHIAALEDALPTLKNTAAL